MADLTKVVLSFSDGSTQEFDAAAPTSNTTPIIEDVKVEESDGTSETLVPETPVTE